VTNQLNEWRNDRWNNTLESLDPEYQSLWKTGMRIHNPSPPLVTPGRLAFSDSEKSEALADSLEAQFQPLNDPSVPAIIVVVNEARRV